MILTRPRSTDDWRPTAARRAGWAPSPPRLVVPLFPASAACQSDRQEDRGEDPRQRDEQAHGLNCHRRLLQLRAIGLISMGPVVPELVVTPNRGAARGRISRTATMSVAMSFDREVPRADSVPRTAIHSPSTGAAKPWTMGKAWGIAAASHRSRASDLMIRL